MDIFDIVVKGSHADHQAGEAFMWYDARFLATTAQYLAGHQKRLNRPSALG